MWQYWLILGHVSPNSGTQWGHGCAAFSVEGGRWLDSWSRYLSNVNANLCGKGFTYMRQVCLEESLNRQLAFRLRGMLRPWFLKTSTLTTWSSRLIPSTKQRSWRLVWWTTSGLVDSGLSNGCLHLNKYVCNISWRESTNHYHLQCLTDKNALDGMSPQTPWCLIR